MLPAIVVVVMGAGAYATCRADAPPGRDPASDRPGDRDRPRSRLQLAQGLAVGDRISASGLGGALLLTNVREAWFLAYRYAPPGVVQRAGSLFTLDCVRETLWLDERLRVVREAVVPAGTLLIDDAHAIEQEVVDPTGERLVLMGEREVVALGGNGAALWRRWAPGARNGVFSEDGKRVALIAQGGLLVLDAATGDVVTAGCGWLFGRVAETWPARTVLGAPPLCAEGAVP